eukprot:12140978-Heterocapsa_arctica.AAC.1
MKTMRRKGDSGPRPPFPGEDQAPEKARQNAPTCLWRGPAEWADALAASGSAEASGQNAWMRAAC